VKWYIEVCYSPRLALAKLENSEQNSGQMKAKRKQYSPIFRAKVALEALKDKETLAELFKKFEVHPTGPADNVSIGSGSASGSRIF
jgi:hypothetical protein